jgi:4a-hydroxytetrahydrobiopterin dehydratase
MDELRSMKCVACRADSLRVTEAEIAELQPQIPDWQLVRVDEIPRLTRVYKLKNFARALDFTNRIGAIAEEQGHHPAILTEWGRVTVSWWTHKIKGLHRNDFIMAARTDELYAEADIAASQTKS